MNPQRRDLSVARHKLSRLFLSALLLACLTFAQASAAQQAAGKVMRLASVEFTGLQRYTKAEALAASGLQTGQNIDVAALDEAAGRLLASGLFKNLTYRYSAKAGEASVTFAVEEAKWNVPVVFDNFVWWSDEELRRAVREQVPSFDGTAPETGGVIEGITKALEKLLRERNIPAQVEYMPSVDPSANRSEHVFAARGVRIPVCGLRFEGAEAIREAELLKKSKPILEQDYSRKFVTDFAPLNLGPLYRERGHLRVGFRDPLMKLEDRPDCRNGVSLTIPVEEGPAYSWEKAEWSGNQALSAQELDAALGMKPGELANGLKIDDGLKKLSKAYWHKGYMTVKVRPAPAYADAEKRVSYRFDISEGPQFKMGTLTVNGLSDDAAARLKSRWRLAPGEVFDNDYFDEFMRKSLVAFFREQGGPAARDLDTRLHLDREKLAVDVTIGFK